MMTRNLLSVCLLFLTLPSIVRAEDPPGFQELQIGDRAPDFKLPGIDGRDWSLADFDGPSVLLVYFTSNHCPVCHAHDPRLMTLLEELKDESLAVVAINPNSGDGLRLEELGYSKYDDSFQDMKPYAEEHRFTFPYLYDGETQATAKRYGCLATPHVFVFDQQRNLRYRGRFDDSRYPDPATVTKQDTRDAIVALLAGRDVEVPVTRPFGCSTKWREKIASVARANDQWEQAEITLDDIDAAGVAKLVKNDTDKYRLFNVWSTTCAPCVVEFPGLIRISRRMGMRSFELITLSTDLPQDREKVIAFLDNQRAALPSRLTASLEKEGRKSNNYLYTGASMDELIEALDPQWEGPQPHTVLVAPGGEIVFRHNGLLEEEKLLEAILKKLTGAYQPE
ncbi:redoxin domain-containing protein [Novipirellula artificiosorum]|uniref:Thiol-disulfide oxidoreductase n=1 Tax=Novipirellula artificiosorum TaxID=2528016 RepID=A0A5C6DMK2_9BACT|nr:redoxin domain-containing protein [Novipirellula artificiosorum]TWU36089.1 thiol-disulfide oxidoreductase [Novipirellula artificiosorum]